MLFSLIFAAAIAGSASAASMPKLSYGQWSGGKAGGYGGGHGGGYSSESSSASPVAAYPGTGSPAPSSVNGVYPVPPSGSLPPYMIPSGTGINSHSPYPVPSGSIPLPNSPTGAVPAQPPGPTGSGSALSPPGPTGTGSLPPPSQITPHPSPQPTTTTTVYGEAGTTFTKTETGLEVITTFVRCSTPVGTAKGSTYYSTFLTVEYHTVTTTQEVVVCPATPTPGVPTGGSSSGSSGSGSSGSSGSNASPGQPSPEYPPTTTYGPRSLPTLGTCPGATTVYSTLVLTKTVSAGSELTPTHCAECTTYHITLPNGQPTSVIVPPVGSSPGGSAAYPTHAPFKPTYPIGGGTGSVPKPTGSGTGSGPMPTGAAHPSGTGASLPSGPFINL